MPYGVSATRLLSSSWVPASFCFTLLYRPGLAYQWNWRFTYPGQSITVDGGPVGHRPTLVVPVGRPVEISLRSNDVIHEFWVPALDYKMQAFPNHVNHFTITATKAGTWVGRCAVFCGQFHFEMDFLLQAVPTAEFSSWSAAHQGASI